MTKKQLIMDKSIELFARQGFSATSVQQITDHCGISKGAFYLSFKSKDELILAIIDDFMKVFISELDHLVRNSESGERLLYNFYHKVFDSYSEYSDLAKIFLKEQMHSLNEELLQTLQQYNGLFNDSILYMVERTYGERVEKTKHDLVHCIQGFMKMYSELLLFTTQPVDVDMLCDTLVEKTDILAEHITTPFLDGSFTETMLYGCKKDLSKEEIHELLDNETAEATDPIVQESLMLLRRELDSPQLAKAVLWGLIGNLQRQPELRWTAYVLRGYFELD